jgi:3'-phosphoadenosine 5'-phosphosulfate sulfotransferase (PAPS reductase)/FAD synthetase
VREVIQFSGGKDSTALLYHLRDKLPGADVMFTDTGAVFPHVIDYVTETCRDLGANLIVVRPPIPVQQHIAEHGLPSDIVPDSSTDLMSLYLKEAPPRLQSAMSCCGASLFAPMYNAVKEGGYTVVYRGTKLSDERTGLGETFTVDGVEYRHPLWTWSDEDVRDYLDDLDVKLPEHYAAVNDSLDCYCCTAHTRTSYAADRLEWIRKNYPDKWPSLSNDLRTVRRTVAIEAANFLDATAIADDGEQA